MTTVGSQTRTVPPSEPLAGATTGRFGAFGGVFTPCTLTILGVIMFLRLGQVVGNAGVWGALGILLAAKVITTLTALSLSAIATNTRVRGGGAYYLIGRSLGVAFGGAIGVVFYLAQAVSVAMYLVGFAEAFTAALPHAGLAPRDVASLVNLAVFACVYVGAGWAIRVQYGILALLALAIGSFVWGAFDLASADTLQANLDADYVRGADLFTMFALFFPAVTGIMAGANMSGDLKDPARAIPRGTLASILVTGVVYLGMVLLLGAAADRGLLQTDTMVVRHLAVVPLLVTLGVFAATLSSGLGSMMGAPRILQALARDGVFRRLRLFGKGSGADNEPRRAIVLTFVIAQGGILLGDLDAIAPIITMFFMITYGYLNLATFYEAVTRNPSYRPTFRFSHWSTALAGALGCLAVMFMISPLWALVAIVAMALLQWYVARQDILATWGDVKSGVAFERARRNLLVLEREGYHPKNWRPGILVLSGGAGARPHLSVYAHWLAAGRGILTLAQVIRGDVDDHLQRRVNQEGVLRRFILEQEIEAFPAVLVAPSLPLGIEALVQCYGLGPLRPNVVLSGWSEDPERSEDFVGIVRTVAGLERSVVLVQTPEDEAAPSDDPWVAPRGPIDVWWRGKANGQLMVLLAHMLTQNDAWRGRPVRLLRMVPAEAGRAQATEHLQRLVRAARVRATARVIVGTDFREVLHRVSGRSAVVFLGFEPPAPGEHMPFVRTMGGLMEGLGTCILVWSAGDVHLEA